MGYTDIAHRPARTFEDTRMDFMKALHSMAVLLAEDATSEDALEITKTLVMRGALMQLIASAAQALDDAVEKLA